MQHEVSGGSGSGNTGQSQPDGEYGVSESPSSPSSSSQASGWVADDDRSELSDSLGDEEEVNGGNVQPSILEVQGLIVPELWDDEEAGEGEQDGGGQQQGQGGEHEQRADAFQAAEDIVHFAADEELWPGQLEHAEQAGDDFEDDAIEPGLAGQRPKTAAFYAAHKDSLVYDNALLTVELMCYFLLAQKQRTQQRDTAFDEHCRVLHDVLLPQPNFISPSLYLMRKVSCCECQTV